MYLQLNKSLDFQKFNILDYLLKMNHQLKGQLKSNRRKRKRTYQAILLSFKKSKNLLLLKINNLKKKLDGNFKTSSETTSEDDLKRLALLKIKERYKSSRPTLNEMLVKAAQ